MAQEQKADNPEWVDKVLAAYKAGASDVEVCQILNWKESRFLKVYAENSQFQDLVDLGRMHSKAWWNKQARENLHGKPFNFPLWHATMKNRFGWAEKVETYSKEPNTEQLSMEEIQSRIEQLQKDWAKSRGKLVTDANLIGGKDERN